MRRDHRRHVAGLVLTAVLMGAGCAAPAPVATTTIEFATLNDSGVTGTVALIPLSDARTRVEVRVQAGANPDMPAHIHPGSCAELVPQPKYPLQNVANGFSATEVPAGVVELIGGGLAVNLHRSNDDLATYTACADLR